MQLNIQKEPDIQRQPSKLIRLHTGNISNVSQPNLTLNINKPNTEIKTNTEIKPLTLTLPNNNNKTIYPTPEDYKQYDQRTHVYMKPDTYIGGDERMLRGEWLYDIANAKMLNTNIEFTPGCERLYLEVLTNASDNVGRSRRAGIDPGKIEITMTNSLITIINYGLPIPIDIHPKEKIYVPQMLFGSMLTSSNYEVERHEAGTNGIGAKAANIFSKEFTVIVHDHIRHLKYVQIWRDNMLHRTEPQIEPYYGKMSSVQVTYLMDFARFKYPVPFGNQGGYPNEAMMLFARHAIDISFTAKTSVIFNGTEFNYANIRDYARLYFGEVVDRAIVHYQWPVNTEIKNKKKGYQVATDSSISPIVELIAVDTPDEGSHISFVNCMMTRDGGVHVNAAIKAVGDSAVKMINEDVLKKLTKQNRGKELDAKEKRSHTITINDVKPHISILLSVRVTNPKFTSQTKSMLHSADVIPKIDIDEDELRAINRWQLMDRLYATIQAKQFASAAKTDGKQNAYVTLKHGVDANQAGKSDRLKCVLYITEGKSGAGYANQLVTLVPGGRDFIGVLPMRGKGLNVMKADKRHNFYAVEKNAEIKELKKMLGLGDGVDYSTPATFNKLRYGAIMIMADSDVDGKHIIGLILNFFHCRFPQLLARGFVMYYRTPTIRVTKGKTKHKFYLLSEYEDWKAKTSDHQKWTHKYYKGLGSSKDADVKDDYAAPKIVRCLYDANAPDAMKLAFDPDMTDRRKEWISKWTPILDVELIQMQPISQFINKELILFSIADVQRSIPKLIDGFKESHRKIVYASQLKWKISPKHANNYNEIKVAQFTNFVAEKTHYQHGELNLNDVVVGMSQDFLCANNIAWFTKDGQFGTRYEGGKDAADARYLYMRPEMIYPYIIRKEDRPILNYLEDEGDEIEPSTFYPIIPTILVNGGNGIGTGYSTFIPNHNPLDIIYWLRNKLLKEDQEIAVLPWYRGFKGTIKIIDRSKKRDGSHKLKIITLKLNIISDEVENLSNDLTKSSNLSKDDSLEVNSDPRDELIPDEENDDNDEDKEGAIPLPRQLLSMITLGDFKVLPNGTIIINELPIGRWGLSYHKWLEKLVEDKHIVGFRDLCADDVVYFEIYGFKETPSHKTLKLQRSYGMSNMVLLDENSRPHRYDTSADILEVFYRERLPIYGIRRKYILDKLTAELDMLENKVRFVRAVAITKELEVRNRKKADIKADMVKLNINVEILDTAKIGNITADEVDNLLEEIVKKQIEHQNMLNLTAERMWLNELQELEDIYRNVYNVKKPVLNIALNTNVGLNTNVVINTNKTLNIAQTDTQRITPILHITKPPMLNLTLTTPSPSNITPKLNIISSSTTTPSVTKLLINK